MNRSQRNQAPRLRKSLGQHHLRSSQSLRPLLEFLDVGGLQGGTVLEIGPGGGVLTERLLELGARVVAVELDQAWAFELHRGLKRHAGPAQRLSLWVGDATLLDWSRLNRDWQVAGNLPYNVATVIVREALRAAPRGTRLGFLVQLEVAQRLCARPGDRSHGALSVLVQARVGSVDGARLLGRVRPGAFHPPPKVDSAFVGLELGESIVAAGQLESFESLVFAGYAQRRKTLANSLGSRYSKALVGEALEAIGEDRRCRAEVLSADQWRRLGEHLGALDSA